MHIHCRVAVVVAAGLLFHSTKTLSDDTLLEEIIVRGELRETSLSKSSSSVSVIAMNDQERASLNHLEELLGRVPNVNFSSGASRARFLQIRGIGERGQFAEPLNPSVGILLDGVDMSGIGTAATLFDIEQVEVFKGPQGTLYGANALAGLINITSHSPSEEFTARVALDAGNYDARGVGAVLSGPIREDLGVRFAARSYRDDGFIDNAFLGRSDTTRHDEQTFRGKIVWQPSESSEAALTYGHVLIDNGYDNFSLDNDRTTLSDQPGQDEQTTNYASVHWSTQFDSGKQVMATAGHASSDIDYGYDEDWTFEGFHPSGYSSTDRYRRDRSTTTVDVRLLSGSRERADGVNWVVGFFGLTQSVDLRRDYTFFPEPFFSVYDVDRAAFYGDVSVPFGARWTLRAGLRTEHHRAEYTDSSGVGFSPSDDLLGGRLQFERELSPAAFWYAGVTRGYKAGGFNTDGSLDADLRQFEPEVLWNLETGLRRQWRDGQLQMQAAVFYMQRDDVQINTSIVRPRPNGSSEFIDFIGNGAEGTNYGVEVEADFAISEQLSAYANVGLLETEYRNFDNCEGDDLSGREQAHAPGYQFFAGLNYAIATGWFARVNIEGRDAFFYSDCHDRRSRAYELVHASIGFAADRWSVSLWGRNLTDEDVGVRGFFFGNDPRDGYTSREFIQFGEPRRFGVSVSIEW